MSEQQSRLVVHISAEQSKRNAEALRKELQSLTSSGNQLQAELDKAFKGVNATSQGFNKVGAEAHKATSAIDGHIGAVKQLAAAYISWHGVTKGIQHADNYTGLENRLKLVTNGQLELNKATADTYAIAQKTGQEWQSTATVYQRFAQNADKLNLTQEDTARLTETVAKAIATSGASAASADAALVQFGQSLASGVFRGEEFNSVAEQTPALLQAIAQGLGVGISELREMAKDGVLTADVLVKALTNAADNVDANFSKITLQAAQGWTILSNSITRETGALNETYQITSKLVDSARFLSENMDTAAPLALAVAFGFVAKSGATASIALYDKAKAAIASRQATIAEAQAVVVSHQAVVAETTAIVSRTGAELAFVQAKLQAANAQMIYLSGMQKVAFVERTIIPLKQAEIAATNAHTAALRAETTAQNGLNAAKLTAGRVASTSSAALSGLMGLLGGPAGLIGLIVTLGASFLLMRDNSDAVTPSIDAQAKSVGELAEAYTKMNEAQRQIELRKVTEQLEEVSSSAEDAQKQLRYVLNNPNLNNYADGAQKAAIQEVFQALSDGSISAAEAVERLRVAGVGSVEYLSKVQDAALAYDGWRQKVISVATQHDLLNGKLDASKIASDKAAEAQRNLGNSIGGVANSVSNAKNQLDAYLSTIQGVNKEVVKMQEGWAGSTANDKYYITFRTKGYDDAMASELSKVMAQAVLKGLDEASAQLKAFEQLPNIRKMLEAGQAKQQWLDKDRAVEAANGKTKGNSSSKFGVNELVRRQDAQYNYATLESQYKLPRGLLAAISMQESRGNVKAVSEVGARGTMQFMPATARQYGVDVNDIGSSARGAAKKMADLIKMFGGDLPKAITAYHTGEGNVQKGRVGPVGRKYAPEVLARMSSFNGNSTSVGDYSSEIRAAEQAEEAKKRLLYDYMTDAEQAQQDHNNKMAELSKSFSGDELKRLQALEVKRYGNKKSELENEKKLTELALEERIYQGEKFLLTRDDQIKREAELERKRIVLDSKLSGQDKMDAISMNLVKEQFDLSEPYRKFLETIKQTDAIKEYHQTVDWLNQAMKDGAIDVGQYQIALANLNASKPDALKTDFEKNWGSTKQWIDEANDVQARLDQGMAGWLQSSSDALAEFVATGKMNFRDFTVSILQDLAKIAMQKAIAGIVGGMFGSSTSGFTSLNADGSNLYSAMPRFDVGGYTGNGGKYEPAGMVHKGEGVLNQQEIGILGGEAGFNRLRRNIAMMPRHSDGGMAGRPMLPQAVMGGRSTGNVNVTVNNNAGVKVETQETRDEQGNINILLMLEQALSRSVTNGGPLGKSIQSAYGLPRKAR